MRGALALPEQGYTSSVGIYGCLGTDGGPGIEVCLITGDEYNGSAPAYIWRLACKDGPIQWGRTSADFVVADLTYSQQAGLVPAGDTVVFHLRRTGVGGGTGGADLALQWIDIYNYLMLNRDTIGQAAAGAAGVAGEVGKEAVKTVVVELAKHWFTFARNGAPNPDTVMDTVDERSEVPSEQLAKDLDVPEGTAEVLRDGLPDYWTLRSELLELQRQRYEQDTPPMEPYGSGSTWDESGPSPRPDTSADLLRAMTRYTISIGAAVAVGTLLSVWSGYTMRALADRRTLERAQGLYRSR
jgi:hypothetical protein